ncbi:unnamed protein product [Clavelina lepadiformis]|uniref:Uncharacterized protein n=1 Tax=Clavelina lepadiformis TaxID=159417 RepID=A0ABP0GQV7_CLALP
MQDMASGRDRHKISPMSRSNKHQAANQGISEFDGEKTEKCKDMASGRDRHKISPMSRSNKHQAANQVIGRPEECRLSAGWLPG